MKNLKSGILAICVLFFTVNQLQSQELYTDSNAASIANEADAITGWNAQSTLMTSDASDPYDGSYALRIEAPDGSSAGRRAIYSFTVVNGTTYDISIWAKEGSQSNDPAFANWQGFAGFATTEIVGTTWTEYTFSLTANSASASISVYTGSSSGNVVGDFVFVDRISIMPQDTQDPTAPTLTSTAQTDTTADLSWSGATDNVGVTGYNVYKDGTLETTLGNVTTFQVTGLTASTSYNFTVTALDAAANESVASNTAAVTTDSAGSSGGGTVWTESSGDISYTAGNVGIGTSTIPTDYMLAVNGKIIGEELKVQIQSAWPDYVFDEDYDLPSLVEIQDFIRKNGHLPNIPSAKEVENEGIEVGEMNKMLLEKIEELTLYIIQLEQKNQTIEKRLDQLENK
nr:fibronectin type III domain-containing protein [Allomuricauda sp.]